MPDEGLSLTLEGLSSDAGPYNEGGRGELVIDDEAASDYQIIFVDQPDRTQKTQFRFDNKPKVLCVLKQKLAARLADIIVNSFREDEEGKNTDPSEESLSEAFAKIEMRNFASALEQGGLDGFISHLPDQLQVNVRKALNGVSLPDIRPSDVRVCCALVDQVGEETTLTFFLSGHDFVKIYKSSSLTFKVGGRAVEAVLAALENGELVQAKAGDDLTLWGWRLPEAAELDLNSDSTVTISWGKLTDGEYNQQGKSSWLLSPKVALERRGDDREEIGLRLRLSDLKDNHSVSYALLYKGEQARAQLSVRLARQVYYRLEEAGDITRDAQLMSKWELREPSIEVDDKAIALAPQLVCVSNTTSKTEISVRAYVPMPAKASLQGGTLKITRWCGSKSKVDEKTLEREAGAETKDVLKCCYGPGDNISYRLLVHKGLQSDATILLDFGSYTQQLGVVHGDGDQQRIEERIEFRSTCRAVGRDPGGNIPAASDAAQRVSFKEGVGHYLWIDMRDFEPQGLHASSGTGSDDFHGLKARLFLGKDTLQISSQSEGGIDDVLCGLFVQILCHDNIAQALKALKALPADNEIVVGMAIAHPGYVKAAIYSKIIKAAGKALGLALKHLPGSFVPGPVRGFSEPVAIGLALASDEKVVGQEAKTTVLCLDIGHQTLDVAVLTKDGRDGLLNVVDGQGPAWLTLLSHGSANAGGTYLNMAISNVLADVLTALSPQSKDEIRQSLPALEADLRRAWDNELQADVLPRDSLRLMERQQYAVRQIDLAKRRLEAPGRSGNDFVVTIAEGYGEAGATNAEPLQSCFSPELLGRLITADRLVHRDAERKLEIDPTQRIVTARVRVDDVQNSELFRCVLEAAKATIEDVVAQAVLAADTEIKITSAVIAGCGGQSRLFDPIRELVHQQAGRMFCHNARGEKGKQALLKGLAMLAQNHAPLIADIEPPLHVLEFDDGGELIEVSPLVFEDDNNQASLTMQKNTCSIMVVDRGQQVLDVFRKYLKNPQISADACAYIREAFFLTARDEADSRHPVSGSAKICFERDRHVAMKKQGEDYLLGTYLVTVSVREADGPSPKSWRFCSPGTVNQ